MSGLITAVFIVLTCNIVTGIMIGFASLVIGRLVSGEWRKLNIGTVLSPLRWWRSTRAAGRFKLSFDAKTGGSGRPFLFSATSCCLLRYSGKIE
jgi:hypothetical protein